jgi:RNA polymerase sigma-70 factor (ECF subfamily)
MTGIELAAMDSLPVPEPACIAGLTRRLAAHDEEAFREFHRLYFDRLHQFLLVVERGQEHEAQEALQETLLRVVRYARPFEVEDVFWSWLKAVARSAARDRGRRQRRYLNLLQRFTLRWQLSKTQVFEEEDRLRELLEESLGELDATDRRLVEEKYLGEATVKELAAQTGLTDKAVESRLLRVRRELRQRLLKKLGPL